MSERIRQATPAMGASQLPVRRLSRVDVTIDAFEPGGNLATIVAGKRQKFFSMRRIVVTGGPGAGKTTLLAALRARGYEAVDESARAIIQERLASGLSPRPPALEFARQILHRDIAQYQQPPELDLVFFDRSVVEALCMVNQAARLEAHELRALLSQYPYDRRVFVLPPWEAIYTTDSERDQTFAEALRVHETLTRWYRRCEYEIIEVPTGTAAERCTYVLRALANADA